MIDKLSLVSLKMQWIKPFINIILAISIGTFIFIVFGSHSFASDDRYLIPSVIMLIWSLLLCSFIYTFPLVPKKALKNDGYIKRLKNNVIRCYFYLLSLIAVLACFGVILVSVRIVGIWFRS